MIQTRLSAIFLAIGLILEVLSLTLFGTDSASSFVNDPALPASLVLGVVSVLCLLASLILGIVALVKGGPSVGRVVEVAASVVAWPLGAVVLVVLESLLST